jgi:hypothetical protein
MSRAINASLLGTAIGGFPDVGSDLNQFPERTDFGVSSPGRINRDPSTPLITQLGYHILKN